MIRLGAEAEQQLDELLAHYVHLNRPEAARALIAAIDQAMEQIERDPAAGILAPRPYPHLAQFDEAWIKAGRFTLPRHWGSGRAAIADGTNVKPSIIKLFSNVPIRYWF